ncbi:MAG: carbonic anhydrase [Lentimicrobiaceae bacterium]|nr:carbonic anhydrase [Lentimicrobiaceae bacterium]
MDKLARVVSPDDIFESYRDTPIGRLLEYHNMGRPHESYDTAQLLIGMCVDNRKQMRIPQNFAFIIRAGGANMRYSEFKVSFAIAIGQVSHMALIGHNHCGMVNLASKQEVFIEGLVKRAGWNRERAEAHFLHYSPMFEIHNETEFVISEAKRLRLQYPGIQIAPMMYIVEDNQLYLVREDI